MLHALEHAYPKSSTPKRQSYISDTTFGFICDRNIVLRDMFRARARFEKTILLQLFSVWANRSRAKYHWLYGFNSRRNIVLYRRSRIHLYYLNRHVKAYVKLDHLARFDKYADELDIALQSDLSSIHGVVRRNKNK